MQCHILSIYPSILSFSPLTSELSWQMLKYGVVRMHDFVQDILNWEKFYLSGRLQKPVSNSCQCLCILFPCTWKHALFTEHSVRFIITIPYSFVKENVYDLIILSFSNLALFGCSCQIILFSLYTTSHIMFRIT